MKEERDSDGEHKDAGQDCPAGVECSGDSEVRGAGEHCLAPVSLSEVTVQEKAALRRFLDEEPARPASGRARTMAWAALKFAATLLLVTGVGSAVGDGNEFDGVDCGVAAKPPGWGKAESGKSKNRESPGGRPPGESGNRESEKRESGETRSRGGVQTDGVYGLRKEFGGWRLVFDGVERFLADSKGLAYVTVLLARPGESLHAAELANLAFGDAVVEQRNIATDDRETTQQMAEARRKCQGAIDDPDATETERQEARDELEEILAWARKHLRGTEGNEQRQVRAIRQSIRRLLVRLRVARDAQRGPDLVLRNFGAHLEWYLWEPSGRGGHRGLSRVSAGLAGRFVYEPPEGLRWGGPAA